MIFFIIGVGVPVTVVADRPEVIFAQYPNIYRCTHRAAGGAAL
jgi:hypothetical protein